MRFDVRSYLISSLMLALATGLKVPWPESDTQPIPPTAAAAVDSLSTTGDLGQVETHMEPSTWRQSRNTLTNHQTVGRRLQTMPLPRSYEDLQLANSFGIQVTLNGNPFTTTSVTFANWIGDNNGLPVFNTSQGILETAGFSMDATTGAYVLQLQDITTTVDAAFQASLIEQAYNNCDSAEQFTKYGLG